MARQPSTALKALREEIDRHSGRALSRTITLKEMILLLDKAIDRLEAEEAGQEGS